jgi:hypothetical protein
MNFRKRKAGPAHLETSPQRTTKETTSRPDNPNPDLSSKANTTNQEVSVTTMDIDRPGEDGVIKSNTPPGSPPPPYSSPYPQPIWKGPKHLDPYAPGESMHPGLGALKTKTDATKFPSAPRFPPRTSSLGIPGINTNLTTLKIPKTAPLNTTSPTSEYSSPRDYLRSSLSNIKEEKEEAISINATAMDWQIDALFPSDDFKPEFDDNLEDSPPEASSNDKINSWLAKSFQNYSKPVDDNNNSKIGPSFPSYSKSIEEKDKSKIRPNTLKKDSEKQSTSKRRASKLSNKHSTSDGDSNDAGSENSTIKPPSFILPKELEEPEDTGVKIYWDGSIWPPENKHEKMKIEEICKSAAVARGFTEVVIM